MTVSIKKQVQVDRLLVTTKTPLLSVVMETQAHTHLVPGVHVISAVERINTNINSNGLD